MKLLLPTLIAIALSSSVFADEASHKALAVKVLELTDSQAAMRTGFFAVIDPMIDSMKKSGMPEAAATEVKAAVIEWFDSEVKWSEIQPKLAEVYVNEFTEEELRDLVAFYETPTGRKTVKKLPVVMQKGAQIGQDYVAQKQESLGKKVQEIIKKHQPANP